jgi:hypothetical protein
MYATTNHAINIIGVTGSPRVNVSARCRSRRHKGSVIFLGRVAPVMITLEAEFILANFGVDVLAGEFVLKTPDGYLRLENLDAITGLTVHPSGGNGIPLTKEYSDKVSVGTIYSTPVPIEL